MTDRSPSGKREANRRVRTQELIEASTRLFLERGLSNVSIDDITREAGVAKGNFYRYFANKTELVRMLLAPSRQRVLRAFEQADTAMRQAHSGEQVQAAYLALGGELAQALVAAPGVTRFYLQESRAPAVDARTPVRELEAELVSAARRLTDVAFSLGFLRKVHPQVSTLAVIGATERLMLAYFNHELELDLVVATQDLVTIVLSGLRGMG